MTIPKNWLMVGMGLFRTWQRLLDQGISSISLNPDTVVDTLTQMVSHKKA